MNLALWAPTIITFVTAIFMAGMLYGKLNEHDEKISNLDMEVQSIKVRIGLGEIELAKLQSWRDGYNAATNRHSTDQTGGS